MKKLAMILALLICVASMSMAATAKKADVAKSSGGFTGVSLNSIGCPSARFDMGTFALEVGGTIVSAGGATNTTLIGKGEMPLNQISDTVRTYWAPTLMLNSAGGTSTTTISVVLGAEYTFTPKLAIFADLTAFSLTSAGGTTTWQIGANNGIIISGGRLYF
jgi:hypothetical protein